MSTKRTKSRPRAGAPKPLAPSSDERVETLEAQVTSLSTQVAVLSTQIENVAKFLALGIATQMQSELTTAGAPPTMQDKLRAALQADAAQS